VIPLFNFYQINNRWKEPLQMLSLPYEVDFINFFSPFPQSYREFSLQWIKFPCKKTTINLAKKDVISFNKFLSESLHFAKIPLNFPKGLFFDNFQGAYSALSWFNDQLLFIVNQAENETEATSPKGTAVAAAKRELEVMIHFEFRSSSMSILADLHHYRNKWISSLIGTQHFSIIDHLSCIPFVELMASSS